MPRKPDLVGGAQFTADAGARDGGFQESALLSGETRCMPIEAGPGPSRRQDWWQERTTGRRSRPTEVTLSCPERLQHFLVCRRAHTRTRVNAASQLHNCSTGRLLSALKLQGHVVAKTTPPPVVRMRNSRLAAKILA